MFRMKKITLSADETMELQLLSPPGPAHGDRGTSIIKKRAPEPCTRRSGTQFRHRDSIRHGNQYGCGKDAGRESGGARYLLFD